MGAHHQSNFNSREKLAATTACKNKKKSNEKPI
jgi:hypothetical protein